MKSVKPSQMIKRAVRHRYDNDNKNPMYVHLDVSPYVKDTNKFGDVVGDCIIRAISTAEDRPYKSVAKDLLDTINRIGIRYYATFDEYYLDERGAEKITENLKKGRKRITIKEFAEMHPRGRYVITARNYTHMTCVINGICYDTFDCTKWKVYDAWKIPTAS